MSSPNTFNQAVIEEFRANGGEVSGQFAGAHLLLLTTAGAKSKQPRTNPVAYTKDGGTDAWLRRVPAQHHTTHTRRCAQTRGVRKQQRGGPLGNTGRKEKHDKVYVDSSVSLLVKDDERKDDERDERLEQTDQ